MDKGTVYNILGLIVGVAIIIAGGLIIDNTTTGYSTTYVDYAKFGADYYTEQYAATRAVVTNAAAAANNILALENRLTIYIGLAFVFSGILVSLSYAKKIAVGSNPPICPISFNAPATSNNANPNDELPDL